MKNVWKVGLLAGMLMPFFASAADSVWKDALIHIRGGRDLDGNGRWTPNPLSVQPNNYESGKVEIPDVRREAITAPNSNKLWYRSGRGTSDSLHSETRHETMDVVSAAWGNRTLKDQPCLVFPAENWTENGTTYHYGQSFMLWSGTESTSPLYQVTGDKFTVLARLRMDGFTSPTATDQVSSVFFGTQTSSGEIRLGFRKNTAKNKDPYLNVTMGNATYPDQANTNVAFTVGEWIEVAYVFDGDHVRISCGRPDQLRRWATLSTPTGFSSRPTKTMYLGSIRAGKISNAFDDFRGVIHTFAMWNRALSDEEVVEAFAGPGAFLVRIGEEGCSQDLFAGACRRRGEGRLAAVREAEVPDGG